MSDATDQDVRDALLPFDWVDEDALESADAVDAKPEWTDSVAHTHVETASGTPNELAIYGTDDLDDSCWLVATGDTFTDLESVR